MMNLFVSFLSTRLNLGYRLAIVMSYYQSSQISQILIGSEIVPRFWHSRTLYETFGSSIIPVPYYVEQNVHCLGTYNVLPSGPYSHCPSPLENIENENLIYFELLFRSRTWIHFGCIRLSQQISTPTHEQLEARAARVRAIGVVRGHKYNVALGSSVARQLGGPVMGSHNIVGYARKLSQLARKHLIDENSIKRNCPGLLGHQNKYYAIEMIIGTNSRLGYLFLCRVDGFPCRPLQMCSAQRLPILYGDGERATIQLNK